MWTGRERVAPTWFIRDTGCYKKVTRIFLRNAYNWVNRDRYWGPGGRDSRKKNMSPLLVYREPFLVNMLCLSSKTHRSRPRYKMKNSFFDERSGWNYFITQVTLFRSSKDFSVFGSIEDNPFDWKLLVSDTFQDALDTHDCSKPLLTFELAEPTTLRFVKYVADSYAYKGAVLGYLGLE